MCLLGIVNKYAGFIGAASAGVCDALWDVIQNGLVVDLVYYSDELSEIAELSASHDEDSNEFTSTTIADKVRLVNSAKDLCCDWPAAVAFLT